MKRPKRKQRLTLATFMSMLGSLILVASCINDQLPDLYAGCPLPPDVDATGIAVSYLPFQNRYSLPSDTVLKQDFQFVVELIPTQNEDSTGGSQFPFEQTAGCYPQFNFTNISNIAITLVDPLGDLRAGSDISYLFQDKNRIRLSDLRDFKNFEPMFGLKFIGPLENYTQFHTRVFLFLRDGTHLVQTSKSPVIRTP